IIESPSKTALLTNPKSGDFSLEDFPTGSLFGKQCELKWKKRRNSQFHLVLIAEEGISPLAQCQPTPLRPIQASEYGLSERVYFWGQPHGGPSDGQWYEARIPRLIDQYRREFARRRVALGLSYYEIDV